MVADSIFNIYLASAAMDNARPAQNYGDVAGAWSYSGLDTSGGTAGGGDVLQYIGENNKGKLEWMNNTFIKQLETMPYLKVAIVVLIAIAVALIIIKLLEIKSPFKGRTIVNELRYLDKVREHDKSILQANNFINSVTKIVEHSPFSLNKTYIDYWTYNLTRANVRIPGGSRIMKPQEFNACIKSAELIFIIIDILIILFFNAPLGTILLFSTILFASTMPMTYIRQLVKTKDSEIIENFADFYLMIHYVLLASAGTPIANIMKSFDKTTSSEEMHRFVDSCVFNIDTYGEYEATRHIASEYREIAQVGKLMRLIRQANEGGDVRSELMGFRQELLNAKKYEMEKRMNKMIMKAQFSFNILVPILIQAVISAMAIYLKDLGIASSFM